MKKHNINDLEKFMINIIEYGKETSWKAIEMERNPLKRCEMRKLFAQAVKKIEKGK